MLQQNQFSSPLIQQAPCNIHSFQQNQLHHLILVVSDNPVSGSSTCNARMHHYQWYLVCLAPAEPVAPLNPCAPAEPVAPLSPVAPINPCAPDNPCMPGGPGAPGAQLDQSL
jgi:hypothetical protein